MLKELARGVGIEEELVERVVVDKTKDGEDEAVRGFEGNLKYAEGLSEWGYILLVSLWEGGRRGGERSDARRRLTPSFDFLRRVRDSYVRCERGDLLGTG